MTSNRHAIASCRDITGSSKKLAEIDDLCKVVEYHKTHQEDEKNKAYLHDLFFYVKAEISSNHSFYEKKRNHSSIQ